MGAARESEPRTKVRGADHDGDEVTSPYVTFDAGVTRAPIARSRAAGRAIAALAAVAAVALVVCLGFVVPSESGGWSLAWMLDVPVHSSPGGSDVSHEAEGDDAAPLGAADAPDALAGGLDEQASAAEPAADADPAGASTGVERADAAGDEGIGASSAPTSPQQGEASNQAGAAPAPEADVLHVTVTVTSDAAAGEVSADQAVALAPGASAYDALCALGLSVRAQHTMYGTYVQAIGGLAEKQHGASSGWMYAVNGQAAPVAASSYALADGDTVSWYYVTGD